ncbi:MAG: hypothetical protein LBU69_03540 [Deltaproteobacteria bacterium]|nr:hypothetical protein [Deltaproteobacteria bacterium]
MAEPAPNKPSIRCPHCSNSVVLPAETCPSCGYNFRTGQRPALAIPPGTLAMGPDSGGRKKLALIAGGTAVVIVLIILAFFLTRPGTSEEPLPAPGGGGGGPMTIETIRNDSPVLNPARTINRAKDVADIADQRNEEMKEISKE